jgi:hypothetical protein
VRNQALRRLNDRDGPVRCTPMQLARKHSGNILAGHQPRIWRRLLGGANRSRGQGRGPPTSKGPAACIRRSRLSSTSTMAHSAPSIDSSTRVQIDSSTSRTAAPGNLFEDSLLAGEQPLGANALISICALSIPLDDLTGIIAQRHGSDEEPAVMSVAGSYTRLRLDGLPGKQTGFPVGD